MDDRWFTFSNSITAIPCRPHENENEKDRTARDAAEIGKKEEEVKSGNCQWERERETKIEFSWLFFIRN